ncbi:MAG: insulinase family protein [Candidatus Omnitrophica bacterium]|nr:insulinase family protein [Candidatus Omnitrophota bacterium]
MEQPVPQVTRKVLPNGLTLLVQEDHAHPLVAFEAVVRTGSATEGPWMGTGISHVVEHMLFKGTARRPVGAVEREARSYGGTSQGFTTYDTTAYQLVSNKEFWPQGADLMVDALFFPSMDPEEFTKERQVVLRELKMGEDDPGRTVWNLLFENAYRVHPYHVPVIGYEPLLKKLTRKDLLEYHRSRYLPNSIVLSVVGDVETPAVIRRIEELTSSIPPGSVIPQALPAEPLPTAPREIRKEAQVNLGVVAVGFPSVSVSDRDLYPLDLLAWLLGNGPGSRLDRALKETGRVYSIDCSNYTPRDPGLFVVTMRLDPDRIPEAVRGLAEQIARAKTEEFTVQEVEAARKALLSDYLSGRQTVTAQASDLALNEMLLGDPTFAYRYVQQMGRVTLADLKRVAVQYLKEDRATTVKLLPKKGASPLEGPVSLKSSDESSAEKVVLDNGLRIILRQEKRIPLVTMQVSLLGGVRYETGATNGICALTARMLIRGTRRKSAQEITDLVREMGGELSPASGRNSLGLTIEVMSSELPRAIALLGEILRQPAFPAEEMEKERKLLLGELKTREEDPFSWGMRRLAAILFTKHPYGLDPSGDPGAVARLRREEVTAFYQQVQDPGQMVVSVVGDFKRQELLDLLKNGFGGLEPKRSKPVSVPKEPPLTSMRERLEKTSRQEGLVMIGFPGLAVTDPRVPVLDLIETILSGGAGRLFTEVRERRGLAYTVGAFAIDGVDPGAFVLYALTDPANIQTVRQALLEEIGQLRSAPVPEEEFRRAQQGLLGAHRIARQAQGALAAQMGLDELLGLGFDFFRRYDAQVQTVKPSQVQELAKTLLDPQRCVVVIGEPGGEEKNPSLRANEVIEAISH